MVCMASGTAKTTDEEGNSSELSHYSTESPELPDKSERGSLDFDKLFAAYDTVVKVQQGYDRLGNDDVSAIGDEVLTPDREAYDSPGESLYRLREELDGDTLVVAFGFRGDDLPTYIELQSEELHPEGNWWDEPEKLDADYLFDRITYEGALNPNGFDSEPLTHTDGLDRGLYLFRQN